MIGSIIAGLGGGAREVGRQRNVEMENEERQRQLDEQRAFDQLMAKQERVAREKAANEQRKWDAEQRDRELASIEAREAARLAADAARSELQARTTQVQTVAGLQRDGFYDARGMHPDVSLNKDFDPFNPEGQAFEYSFNPEIFHGEQSMTPGQKANFEISMGDKRDYGVNIQDIMEDADKHAASIPEGFRDSFDPSERTLVENAARIERLRNWRDIVLAQGRDEVVREIDAALDQIMSGPNTISTGSAIAGPTHGGPSPFTHDLGGDAEADAEAMRREFIEALAEAKRRNSN